MTIVPPTTLVHRLRRLQRFERPNRDTGRLKLMFTTRFEALPIGKVESPLVDKESAPKQGVEGSPDAWLVFDPAVIEGIDGLHPGDRVIVLTWLDRAQRDVLRVHPRDNFKNPQRGVFSTRSADRPNPIGL